MISKQIIRLDLLLRVICITVLLSGTGKAENRSQIEAKLFKRSYDPQVIQLFHSRHGMSSEALDTGNADAVHAALRRIRRYDPLILYFSDRYSIAPNLIRAIIWVESGGHPRAVSSKGAVGLMQIMPGTANDLGVTNILDPQQNIHGGVKYLRHLLDYFGEVEKALWAYNAGPSALLKSRKVRGAERYVEDVLSIKSLFDSSSQVRIIGGHFLLNERTPVHKKGERSRPENSEICTGSVGVVWC